MRLSELLKGVESPLIKGNGDPDIQGIRYDSRKVMPGDIFVALRGKNVDGHRFIDEAVKRGASALLVEKGEDQMVEADIAVAEVHDTRRALAIVANRFYNYPSRSMTLVGITGTNGKTTSSYLIKGILEEAGKKAGLIGTISYQLADETIPASHTTPESSDLQEILAKMKARGLEYVVMEVSSHALALDRVFGTGFDIALFTNLTQDHLDFHASMEDYFNAKLKLFQDLKSEGNIKTRAVINLDDNWGRRIIGRLKTSYLGYSLSGKGEITARDRSLGMDGTSFIAETPVGKFEVKSRLVGNHNLQNILASIGVGIALNIPVKAIQDGIARIERIPGRFERIYEGQAFEVFVDYAHTEDALRRLLSMANDISRGRIITVFGCGGDRDKGKRPKMGRAASEMSDLMIITSDNPRGEDPIKIIEEIEAGVAGMKKGVDYLVIEERRTAIKTAIGLARPRDIVILAGKGHEDYQIIGKKRINLDDREVAREAIKGKLKGGGD